MRLGPKNGRGNPEPMRHPPRHGSSTLAIPLAIKLARRFSAILARASLFCETPSGFMNSSRRISPGGIGSNVFAILSILAAPQDLDDLGTVRACLDENDTCGYWYHGW